MKNITLDVYKYKITLQLLPLTPATSTPTMTDQNNVRELIVYVIDFDKTKERKGSSAEGWNEINQQLDDVITALQTNKNFIEKVRSDFEEIKIVTPDKVGNDEFKAKVEKLRSLVDELCAQLPTKIPVMASPEYFIIGYDNTIHENSAVADAWNELHRNTVSEMCMKTTATTPSDNPYCYGGLIMHIPDEKIDAICIPSIREKGSIADVWNKLGCDMTSIIEAMLPLSRNADHLFSRKVDNCYGGVIVYIPEEEMDTSFRTLVEILRLLLRHPLKIKCTKYESKQ